MSENDLGADAAAVDTARSAEAASVAPHVGTKHVCVTCGQLAVWDYMPSDSGGDYYCDTDVPRGCSCNYDPETGVESLDDQGRQLPCCEYAYDRDGFDVEEAQQP